MQQNKIHPPRRSAPPLKWGIKRQGFVAIMSAVIIASVITVMALGAGALHLTAQLDAAAYNNREESANLAHSCAQKALLQLAQNGIVSSPIPIDNPLREKCMVEISTAPEKVTITIHATVVHSLSILRLQATTSPQMLVLSQEEI